jgi:thiamine-phosphate pyrophosphorylase
VLHPPLICLITSRHAFRRNPESEFYDHQLSVTAERDCRARQLRAIALAAESGCQLIQIREKDLPAGELSGFVRAAITLARPHGARVLVNDRADIALITGADGVHLRTSSMSAADVRKITSQKQPGEFLIGVSTHTLAEARQAEAEGADFIVSGPVYSPLSKKTDGPLIGLTGLSEVCRSVSVPVLGLGGLQMERIADVLSCGAAGIAAISLFTDPETLQANVRRLLRLDLSKPGLLR